MGRELAIQDRARLLRNIVKIRDILNAHGITCWLHYGTCLGAIRERNFIPHDDDADLGIYAADYPKLLEIIPEIEASGFRRIPDEDWEGRLIQFLDTEGGYAEQVDIFWEKETRFLGIRQWDLGGRLRVPYKYLKGPLTEISFLGEKFFVPNQPEKFLRRLYGKTWRIPIAEKKPNWKFCFQLKKLRKNPRKLCFYLRRYFRNHLRRHR